MTSTRSGIRPVSTAVGTADRVADLAAAHAVFGCLLREVAAPDGEATIEGGTARVRLRHLDVLLRCAVDRVSPVGAHRYAGPVQRLTHTGPSARTGTWENLDAAGLATLLADELTARTGAPNDEFVEQVLASRDTVTELLGTRPDRDPTPTGEPAVDAYVDSEQSLVLGHPHHPAPKWRTGDGEGWRAYAPELRTAFRLHWLAVPDDLVAGAGPFDALVAALDPPTPPPGHRVLPVHPWQLSLVPPVDGRLRDLGPPGRRCGPPPASVPSTPPTPTCSSRPACTYGSPTACARTPATS
ncbi:hypothetical protein GCM10027614_19080 [Micromonospora vulcania]